uniref:ATP synthase complex subunit 8 n=1 Tax=Oncocephalus breviscutum TaxID=1347735 RepID=U5JEU7_9HEMI|nr:ATP synthase F0 subunit 8 [Oncocephalus breviscutum]AGO28003.1 ATP synthase F0 subunit 8 [Oncocephalus breviscutum]
MPQMAPIWWMLLFITFIMSLMMIHTLMFYIFEKSPNQNEIKQTIKNINWKW